MGCYANDLAVGGCLDRCRPLKKATPLSTRGTLFSAPSQKSDRRPTGFTQVGPWFVMRESSILTDGEPVRFVSLSVHHKNVGMFVRHDFKAHSPPPLHSNSHRKRGYRCGNNFLNRCFYAASHPRAAL